MKDAKLEAKKAKRKDYYKILGIGKNATEPEIKKGYRVKALKWHPGTMDHANPAYVRGVRWCGCVYLASAATHILTQTNTRMRLRRIVPKPRRCLRT